MCQSPRLTRLQEHPFPRFRIFAFFIHPLIYGKSLRGGERRFLELVSRFGRMGIEAYALEAAPSLRRAGVETTFPSVEVKWSTKFRTFPNWIQEVLMAIRVTRIVLRLFKRIRYDVIYVNWGTIANTLPAYVISRLMRRPIVFVFHGMSEDDLKYGFADVIRLRVKNHFPFPLAVFRSLLDLLRWAIYHRAEACIAVSEVTAAQVARRFKTNRVYVAGNGVDLGSFSYTDKTRAYFEAAYCGSLEGGKGIETLLRAWESVTKLRPLARLVLIGEAMSHSSAARYREMVTNLGLSDNVVFAGHVPYDEVPSMLGMAEIFVFPSKAEGFPLVVLEAMACGLPCIISDIPVLRENFGEAAVLVKPDDIEGFQVAITTLLTDESKRQALGLISKEYVKKFTWDEVARKEVEVFRKLLRKR